MNEIALGLGLLFDQIRLDQEEDNLYVLEVSNGDIIDPDKEPRKYHLKVTSNEQATPVTLSKLELIDTETKALVSNDMGMDVFLTTYSGDGIHEKFITESKNKTNLYLLLEGRCKIELTDRDNQTIILDYNAEVHGQIPLFFPKGYTINMVPQNIGPDDYTTPSVKILEIFFGGFDQDDYQIIEP